MRDSKTITATLACMLAIATPSRATEEAPRIDYLTFAQGAIAVSVGDEAAARGVGLEKALAAIDGNRAKYSLASKPVSSSLVTELTYELPAPTVFDRFAVPDVFETPSLSQTFTKSVEVLGSSVSATEGFVTLAKGDLAVHAEKGLDTELPLVAKAPVRWVKLRLSGGIDDAREEFFADFSEIIGNGTQEAVPLSTRFTGTWKYRANVLELVQDGPFVTGCYDTQGTLHGTVTGNVLRATGTDAKSGVPSAFIMMVDVDGAIRGVRSTNKAPFYTYDLPVAPAGTKTVCTKDAAPLGCGSVVHGIGFDFDSAVLRTESAPVLASLYTGLAGDETSTIVIEGHTSSEGADAYNQVLSERRAQAVVADLVRRGLDEGRIRALGKGEREPIASNDDEAGRSLNRRVVVVCTAR